MAEQCVITVINPTEGKRYKMTLKGDVSRLSIAKLKRYLVSSCGLPAEEQLLKYNGVELGEEVLGGEVGISHGSTLTVERRLPASAPFVASPTRSNLEMETLDQQKAMLAHERLRRDEEYRRQHEQLETALSHAERRRIELERERAEREAEYVRLQEAEAIAQLERQRLAQARQTEAEREAARVRDLEARKQQLQSEKNSQRQLEMQRLENERKKMLVQQQMAEYEAERARLERERREHMERVKAHELVVKEKELDLERVMIEGERVRKELELEKAILAEQRGAEYDRLAKERYVDSERLQDARNIAEDRHTSIPRGDATLHRRGASPPNVPPLAYPQPIMTPNGLLNSTAPSVSGGVPGGARSSSLAEKERELDLLRRQREIVEMERAREAEIDAQIHAEREAISRAEELRSRAETASVRSAVPPAASATAHAPPPRSTDFHDAQNTHEVLSPDDARRLAMDNLAHLAVDLGVAQLQLDANNTCVVSIEDKYTLLITFDAATQRLYLYSTLSTFIPKNAETKLRFYEFLLEAALLGRDMCGGGVGLSLKNEFILMSTSLYLPRSGTNALATITPLFVESLVKWRTKVREFLQLGDDTTLASAMGSPVPPTHQDLSSTAAAAAAGRAPSLDPYAAPEPPLIGLEVSDTADNLGVAVVNARGPAARAGILINDIIKYVAGRRTATLRDFQDTVRLLKPGQTASFVLERAGSQLSCTVLVGSSRSKAEGAHHTGNTANTSVSSTHHQRVVAAETASRGNSYPRSASATNAPPPRTPQTQYVHY